MSTYSTQPRTKFYNGRVFPGLYRRQMETGLDSRVMTLAKTVLLPQKKASKMEFEPHNLKGRIHREAGRFLTNEEILQNLYDIQKQEVGSHFIESVQDSILLYCAVNTTFPDLIRINLYISEFSSKPQGKILMDLTDKEGWIVTMQVERPFRHSGLGKLLLSSLEAASRGSELRQLKLLLVEKDTEVSYTGLKVFMEKGGYKVSVINRVFEAVLDL